MGEHNHHISDGIAAGRLTDRCRGARFGRMKKALKILLVIAVVGVIGKIIIDNA